MNARMVVVAFVYSCAVCSLVARAPDDHLVRPYVDRDWGVRGYASLLEKKLFVTPAGYGRILVLPSAGSLGEYALSIRGVIASGHCSAMSIPSCVRIVAERKVYDYAKDHPILVVR